MTGSIRLSVDISLTPEQAFEIFVDELGLAFTSRGLRLNLASSGGSILEGDTEVGTFQELVAGEKISFLWHPKPWEKDATSRLLVTFTTCKGGSTVSVEQLDWNRILGDDAGELLGWFAGEVVAPLLHASSPNRLGDWITDRNARRPSGAKSRDIYSNPIYHWPNFLAILDVLALEPRDYLLEVGCGGGAFLHEALKSGCRASAIDHSPDMVRLASEANRDSIAENRLRIETGDAGSLPFADETFTCAVMTGVLGFLPDAHRAFKEILRVLGKEGRFVAFTSSKELRGTPAAPEPMASRIHFYEDKELAGIAKDAGFSEAKVDHPRLFEFAKKAGIPETAQGMFKGTRGSQMLIAHKG